MYKHITHLAQLRTIARSHEMYRSRRKRRASGLAALDLMWINSRGSHWNCTVCPCGVICGRLRGWSIVGNFSLWAVMHFSGANSFSVVQLGKRIKCMSYYILPFELTYVFVCVFVYVYIEIYIVTCIVLLTFVYPTGI